MRNILLPKIFILAAAVILGLSCASCSSVTGSADKGESLADIKKRLWAEMPPDKAVNLKKVREYDVKNNLPADGRPASFLVSSDNSLYIDDNINGKLFKISSDFQSVDEAGTTSLVYPTRIREFDDNLLVYDNGGINVFHKDGQFVKTIKSFLKLDDFDQLDAESYIVSLAELKPNNGTSYIAVLDSTGKRIDSIGKIRPSDYPDMDNKAFLEKRDGKLYVCYKFDPVFEIYDLKNKNLLNTVAIDASIFPPLLELKKDKKFVNPEPAIFKIPKFTAGIKVVKDRFYVLLHTPSPEIVEYTLDGKEVRRHVSKETQAIDYFGFDVRPDNDTKQFFVGAIDYSGKPSIVVYEENDN